MFSFPVPGWGELAIEYLVIDYNGTIAVDGKMKEGIKEMLEKASRIVKVFIITSDTYESVDKDIDAIDFTVLKVGKESTAFEKAKVIKELGPEKIIAIGNGSNDVLMLKEASLGIAVIGEEGCSKDLLREADIFVKDVKDALSIIIHPERIIATLKD